MVPDKQIITGLGHDFYFLESFFTIAANACQLVWKGRGGKTAKSIYLKVQSWTQNPSKPRRGLKNTTALNILLFQVQQAWVVRQKAAEWDFEEMGGSNDAAVQSAPGF